MDMENVIAVGHGMGRNQGISLESGALVTNL